MFYIGLNQVHKSALACLISMDQEPWYLIYSITFGYSTKNDDDQKIPQFATQGRDTGHKHPHANKFAQSKSLWSNITPPMGHIVNPFHSR